MTDERIDERMLAEQEGIDELARRLEAYASVRLSPDRAAVIRMRHHVVEAAHGRARTESPGWRLIPLRRRVTAVALAAVLTLGGAAVVAAASAPGGPLYGTRIWLQQLTLPADASARAAARLDEIRQRLADADAAARAHDPAAVAAALKAYSDAVDAALRDAAGDPGDLSRLEDNLTRQLAHLEALQATLPAQSDAALTQAIQRASDALERAEQGQQPGDAASPKPGRTPDPNATPKPTRTDATSPTAGPQPSPKGGHSQQPDASAAPSK